MNSPEAAEKLLARRGSAGLISASLIVALGTRGPACGMLMRLCKHVQRLPIAALRSNWETSCRFVVKLCDMLEIGYLGLEKYRVTKYMHFFKSIRKNVYCQTWNIEVIWGEFIKWPVKLSFNTRKWKWKSIWNVSCHWIQEKTFFLFLYYYPDNICKLQQSMFLNLANGKGLPASNIFEFPESCYSTQSWNGLL